jgi:glycerophosphoryl diester phosphodiesterase
MLQADAYHPDEQYLNEESVKRVREAGYFINAYTVNNPLRQKELFDWGVNGVFTDYLE